MPRSTNKKTSTKRSSRLMVEYWDSELGVMRMTNAKRRFHISDMDKPEPPTFNDEKFEAILDILRPKGIQLNKAEQRDFYAGVQTIFQRYVERFSPSTLWSRSFQEFALRKDTEHVPGRPPDPARSSLVKLAKLYLRYARPRLGQLWEVPYAEQSRFINIAVLIFSEVPRSKKLRPFLSKIWKKEREKIKKTQRVKPISRRS